MGNFINFFISKAALVCFPQTSAVHVGQTMSACVTAGTWMRLLASGQNDQFTYSYVVMLEDIFLSINAVLQ